jgi:16S rRNA (cytosine967-C5)-methyltransferase
MSDQGLPARKAAIHLLDEILEDGRLMPEMIQGGALDHLEPADRARAQRLATETLRGLERADRLLQKHLSKYPPLTVRNALRLGTVEICAMGEAPHGVVNSMVELVGRTKHIHHLRGLTNAVLRKIVAAGPEAWNELRVPRLPKWLRGPMVDAWGAENVGSMEAAHFASVPLDITVKSDAAAWAKKLGGEVLPSGSVRLKDAGRVSGLDGFDEGAWWVQDAAAAMPVQLLDLTEGETVLDLCAAPGGKTMQAAAIRARVTAVDISKHRLVRVRENLARSGLHAVVKKGDVMRTEGEYDAIILDAPCSATGTIRRHPDLPHAKDGSEFGDLIELQTQMLDHAIDLLKPGGRLVYCTCSLLPDEGECQVEEILERREDVSVDRSALERDWIDAEWITEEGGLRLLPHFWADKGGMDGFYMAVLRKG